MCDVAEATMQHLKPLVGLFLCASRRAADMQIFDLGARGAPGKGTVGEYALHVQCPWRLEAHGAIVTGRLDLWEPAVPTENFDPWSWDYDLNDTLRDKRIREFFRNNRPIVEDVQTDSCGGATLSLSGNCKLVLFPAGSQGEDWRVFRAGSDEQHFVISGGRVEVRE